MARLAMICVVLVVAVFALSARTFAQDAVIESYAEPAPIGAPIGGEDDSAYVDTDDAADAGVQVIVREYKPQFMAGSTRDREIAAR